MVELQKIEYAYQKEPVLKAFSMSIEKGKITTLFGPSGCGKSTVLKIIAGLILPQSGDVIIDGQMASNLAPEKRQVGFVFQKPLLFPHMRVEENIGFSMTVGDKKKQMTKKQIRMDVEQWMKVFQIEELAKRSPQELSGGQAQRVAVARAIASGPRLLLMDEPFSALDIQARQEMNDWLVEIQKKLGITVLFVTHDVDECLRLSHNVLLMDQDGMVQQGSCEEVYYHPKNERAAKLMGTYNIVDMDLASSWGVQPGIMIRPNMISFQKNNQGEWTCLSVKLQGMTRRYELSNGRVTLYVDRLGEQELQIGQQCTPQFNHVKE